jgi:hypothetical protein
VFTAVPDVGSPGARRHDHTSCTLETFSCAAFRHCLCSTESSGRSARRSHVTPGFACLIDCCIVRCEGEGRIAAMTRVELRAMNARSTDRQATDFD